MTFYTTANLSIVKNACVSSVLSAAVSCFYWIGRGDGKSADAAAVKGMRDFLNTSKVSGVVKIGEGERDKAPMLHIGELFNSKDSVVNVDIAVDPLEGTNLCKNNSSGAMSVICMAPSGSIISAPDIYMQKIGTCKVAKTDKVLDINYPVVKNIHNLSDFLGKPISEINVCVLNRPRHKKLIESIRKIGANVELIEDGDVLGVMRTHSTFGADIDLYLGTGGAPEGILASSYVNSANGFFQAKMVANDTEEEKRLKEFQLDSKKIYHSYDLVKDPSILAISFITQINTPFKKIDRILKNDSNLTINTLIADGTRSEKRFTIAPKTVSIL